MQEGEEGWQRSFFLYYEIARNSLPFQRSLGFDTNPVA